MHLDGIRFDWLRFDQLHFDWLLSPIGLYGFLALGLIASLALFLSMKRELARLRQSLDTSQQAASNSVSAVASQLAALEERVQDRVREPEPAPLPDAGLNLISRAQALRMQQHGESPATIAATLRVPRNEIDLLLKIQKLNTARQPA